MILVTGSAGFVGRATVERLKASGQSVVEYDLPDSILDYKKLATKATGCDTILHIAAIANLYDTAKDPDTTYRVNVEGTYNVMKVCKLQGINLVYISTCCAYGPHGAPEVEANEETKPNACEFYARTKLMGEYIAQEVEATILRLGTVLGPGMRPALFNYKIMDKLRKGEKVEIYGNGSASRNYIYIDDLADAICRATLLRPGGIFNLCGSEVTDLIEVAKVAQEVTGIQGEIVHTKPRDMGDYGENISNYKARSVLNWYPKTSYLEAMKKTWEWMN